MNSSEFKRAIAYDTEQYDEGQLSAATANTANDSATITKAKLATLLVNHANLSKGDAPQIVDAFFETISSALASGASVKLSGFGSFQLRDKPLRPGFNLQTGDRILIAPRRVVTFHASQKLKQQIEHEQT